MKKQIKRAIAWLKSSEGMACMAMVAAAAVSHFAGFGFGAEGLSLATVLAGVAGGSHVVGGPLTTSEAADASPDLLRNELDSRIVKIRPMSTPLDQISRFARSRHAGSMTVDYYSVDTKESLATLAEAVTEPTGTGVNNTNVTKIVTDNDALFEPSETILVPSVKVDAEGNIPLVLYVVNRCEGDEGIMVTAVNHSNSHGAASVMTMPAGTQLVRMGRAAGELDVQTSQFQSLPTKATNNCQIFKAQVEQSTLMKMANKEVGWTFNDQEEAAIVDMRQGMEKNFLFGSRAKLYDPIKRSDVMLTGGIWNQAGNSYAYSSPAFTAAALVSMSRQIFCNNSGSRRKVLFAGSRLVERLNSMESVRVLGPESKKTVWGIDFTEIVTKFGTLYVVFNEMFDQCGHADDGLAVDPDYITKYSHIPFRTEKLDLRSSGVRNTDAIVITEASCLVLRYPQAHTRITYAAAE